MVKNKTLNCKNCEYEWEYKGKMAFYASCPKCHYKVNIKKREVKAQ